MCTKKGSLLRNKMLEDKRSCDANLWAFLFRIFLPIECSNSSFSFGEHPAWPGYFLRNHLAKQEVKLNKTVSNLLCCFGENFVVLFLLKAYWDDSLIEGVRQRLHRSDGHQAVVSCGQHDTLPHVVLPRVSNHQQVVLFEWQLLLVVFVLISWEQRLGEEGSCRETKTLEISNICN